MLIYTYIHTHTSTSGEGPEQKEPHANSVMRRKVSARKRGTSDMTRSRLVWCATCPCEKRDRAWARGERISVPAQTKQGLKETYNRGRRDLLYADF